MIKKIAYDLPTYEKATGEVSWLDRGDPAWFIGEFVNTYLFPLAAIVLFVYLLWGGLAYMLSLGNPDKTKAAWARIWQALLGFVIIFTSWWLIKLIEVIFGINILGG